MSAVEPTLDSAASTRSTGLERMFLRMIWRATWVRRGRALTALAAIAAAAAVATALLNLYVDSQTQLRSELRNYGANVVVSAREGASLPLDALERVQRALGPTALAVPFGYVVARTLAGDPVVVAGTDLALARKLNPWWLVEPIMHLDTPIGGTNVMQGLIGQRAAEKLSDANGREFVLSFHAREVTIVPSQRLRTGVQEDSRIYIDLAQFTAWTGEQPGAIEVAISGTPQQVEAGIASLAAAIPQADVRPVRQVIAGETRVLGKTRAALLAATLLVIATAALCVLATFMSWVLDRRRDFAVMKALGASERLLRAFFAAEAGLVGAAGAVAGFVVGMALAAWIARVNFGVPATLRLELFPPVLLGGVVLALAAALSPISILRRIQPAVMLRVE